MNQIEILTKQTQGAYEWTNKLLESIPYEEWENTPKTIESNVTWQVGHLLMSFYYHSIMVISGHQMDILQKIPLKEYNNYFTAGDPQNALGKISAKELYNQLLLVEQKSIEVIRSLADGDLEKELQPTPIPHPVAENKFEALDWNIKHAMWHCGQLGILKRIVNERYDFGLTRGK
jgi:hypothetical protein